MKKEPLSTSMPKLILAVALIVGIGAVMGVMGWTLTKESIKRVDKTDLMKIVSKCPHCKSDFALWCQKCYLLNWSTDESIFLESSVHKCMHSCFDVNFPFSTTCFSIKRTCEELNVVKKEKIEDETAGWKTYRNEKYGIEFKYPKDFPFFQQPELLVNKIDPDGLSTKICTEGKSGNTSIKKVTAGKNTFCSYVTEDGAAGSTYTDYKYSIIKNNKDYAVHFVIKYTNCGVYGDETEQKHIECEEFNNKTAPEVIDQILSTFKFIEKDETADWKTYRNEEYGFELKYPEEFFTEQVLQPKTEATQCDYANFINNCPAKITINGMPFCSQKTGGGAAGTAYETYNYTTVRDTECFVVSFTVAYPNCSNLLSAVNQEIQEAYDKCMLDNEVTKPETINQILSTFKFTGK